ncbi:hypothetical protein [Kineothrix alysoides]|uniref:hypothetical protein n=1 Tax=Kineothrix alysoides TaxID=1469948 RepID=UPI0004DB90A9|nr:hypothetical protein [Kineothrix alysoides]
MLKNIRLSKGLKAAKWAFAKTFTLADMIMRELVKKEEINKARKILSEPDMIKMRRIIIDVYSMDK